MINHTFKLIKSVQNPYKYFCSNTLCILGFANSDKVLPIYIGDDRTDEDAFKV